jgi:DNA polymerase delta subunit 1
MRVRQLLTLCPYDWDYTDGVGAKEALQIRAWCLDKDNVQAVVRFETYKPHIYFEFPAVGEPGGKRQWDSYDAEAIHSQLTRALGVNSKHLDLYSGEDFVHRKTLYYYQPKPRPMLKLRFRTLNAMNHAARILRKGLYMRDHVQLAGRVHLSEIDPVLKMLVDADVTHSAWMEVKATRVLNEVDKISRVANEYTCKHWKTLHKSDYNIPIRPKILSYDIEQYSHNHKSFPREWAAQDKITTIGCVFFREGEAERKKYALVNGDCICDKPDFEIIRCKSEKELLFKYFELMRLEDPDIVTGYNIVGYDNGIIGSRMQRMAAVWPEVGRLKGQLGQIKRTEWGSNAYGKAKKLNKWYMPGRIVMDYFEETRRSQKWDTYNLDNAAKMILKNNDMQKHKITYEETFVFFQQMQYWLKKPDSPERTKALEDMGRVVSYAVRDSELPAEMILKTNWIPASMEMSNVAGVSMQDMFLGGQQRRCLALLYREAYKMDIILDFRLKWDNFYYEGGKVQDPVQGFHELVLTLDFASLYPNIMIRFNLGHDTLIHPDDLHLYSPDDLYEACVMTSMEPEDDGTLEGGKKKKNRKDLPQVERKFHFIKQDIYQGVTARILVGLIEMRAKVKKQMEEHEEGSLMWTILNLRQNAYKVSANSMYGFFGVRVGGKRPCLEVSASVTYFGRQSITTAIDKIKEKYEGSELIYGDTDSCMFKLPGVTLANAWAKSRELAAFATSLFPKPLKMEAEWPSDMLAMKMKHYAKMRVNPDTNDYYRDADGMREIEFKGLMPARRDTCIWAKGVCTKIIALIMDGFGYAACVDYMAASVNELYNGGVSIDDLVISKTLGAGYVNENATMNVFAKEMAAIDKQINPGERHQYVVCKRGNKKKIGEKMMLLQVYESGDCKDPIDYSYYYHNLLMKKLDIILHAEYKSYEKRLDTLYIKDRGIVTSGMKPAKLIYKVCHLYPDPEEREDQLTEIVSLASSYLGDIGCR